MANFTKVLKAMSAEANGNRNNKQNNDNAEIKRTIDKRRSEDLETEVAKLRLATEAMWNLLAQHLGFTDEHLANVIEALDESDGQKDDRFQPTPETCSCGAKVSAELKKCQYCGSENKRRRMFK